MINLFQKTMLVILKYQVVVNKSLKYNMFETKKVLKKRKKKLTKNS